MMIISLSFLHSNNDLVFFIRCMSACDILISLYVNDMIIIGDEYGGLSP